MADVPLRVQPALAVDVPIFPQRSRDKWEYLLDILSTPKMELNGKKW
nr:MAG TPA: hypothetical protein [Caudoviricetes sp.]